MIRIFSHYVPAKFAVLAGVEVLVVMLAAYLGIYFQFGGASATAGTVTPSHTMLFVLGMLLLMTSMGLYRPDTWQDIQGALVRLLAALVLGFGLTTVAGQFLPSLGMNLTGWCITLAAALVGSLLVRAAYCTWGGRLGIFKSRVLVLGTGSRVMKLAEFAERNHNHQVIGYVAPETSRHYVPLPHVLPMAPGQRLLAVVERYTIDQIVIAVRDRRGGGLPVQELLECRLKGIKVTELATFFEREYRQVLLESLNASWMVLGDGFSQGFFRGGVKRVFDLLASAALLLLALPLMLVTALCICIESGGPIFYRQERTGLGGRPFTLFKFRSMKNDAEGDGTPRWAAANDDRTTRVGRIIRKLRIDELPQIINVFTGEMSFVGPRPERPYFVEKLVKQIPYYGLRHSVKPGITGWAQVRYAYGASLDDAIEKLQYDLYYVKNHSLFLDLMILIATVEVVLWGKGAR